MIFHLSFSWTDPEMIIRTTTPANVPYTGTTRITTRVGRRRTISLPDLAGIAAVRREDISVNGSCMPGEPKNAYFRMESAPCQDCAATGEGTVHCEPRVQKRSRPMATFRVVEPPSLFPKGSLSNCSFLHPVRPASVWTNCARCVAPPCQKPPEQERRLVSRGQVSRGQDSPMKANCT